MGVSATWRKDCQRWQITASRYGLKRTRLAGPGLGKRDAIVKVGDELLRILDEAHAVDPSTALPPTLWSFCAEVYSQKHGVSERTWKQRKYKVAAIMQDLGHLRLPDVNTDVVTEWLKRVKEAGAPLQAGGRGEPQGTEACNDFLTALRAIYRVAIDLDYIEHRPFKNKNGRIEYDTDRPIWSPEMKKRVLAAAKAQDRGIYNLARFLMLTGVRPVEALRLRWSDVVEIPSPTLSITGKGHRKRRLPMRNALGAFFKGLVRSGEAVFPVERGPSAGKRYKYWPQLRWERVCKAAGVPSVRYDLRHTFITEMVSAGTPIAKVAKWCGNSVRVIEARYAHLVPEHLLEISALAGRGLDEVGGPTAAGDSDGPMDQRADVVDLG